MHKNMKLAATIATIVAAFIAIIALFKPTAAPNTIGAGACGAIGTITNSSVCTSINPPPPARTVPRDDDFELALISPDSTDLGGEFILRIVDKTSPLAPIACAVSLQGYAAGAVQVESSDCNAIRLRAPSTPILRAADGRQRASDPSYFTPLVAIGFGPSQSDVHVSAISGVPALSIRNATNVQLAAGSDTTLTRAHPARLLVGFPGAGIPPSFHCEWSDNLGVEVDTRRIYLSPNNCGARLEIVPGRYTRAYYADLSRLESRGFAGQIDLALLRSAKFMAHVTVSNDGDVYSTDDIPIQLEGASQP